MIYRLLILCALTAIASGQGKKPTPISSFVPEGTKMQEMTVPTYNASGEMTSILRADEVEMVDKRRFILDIHKGKAEIVQGQDPLRVEFKKGKYFKPRNLLRAMSPTRIFRSNMKVTGSRGMAMDLETNEIFLPGRTKTILIPEDVVQRVLENAALLMAQPAGLPLELTDEQKKQLKKAEEFATDLSINLSEEERAKLKEAEDAAKDAASKLTQVADELKKEGEELLEKSNVSDKNLKEFTKKTGQRLLKDETQEVKKPNPNQQFPPQALVIVSEGGMYFDAAQNVLVYLKDVVAENDEIKLECTRDLKVFFEPTETEKKAPSEEGISGLGALDMKELFATGNVKITYKKTGKRPHLIAIGEQAHYKMKQEEIIIKGGYPKLSQGGNSSAALELGMWVRLSQKGVVWSKGKLRNVYNKSK